MGILDDTNISCGATRFVSSKFWVQLAFSCCCCYSCLFWWRMDSNVVGPLDWALWIAVIEGFDIRMIGSFCIGCTAIEKLGLWCSLWTSDTYNSLSRLEEKTTVTRMSPCCVFVCSDPVFLINGWSHEGFSYLVNHMFWSCCVVVRWLQFRQSHKSSRNNAWNRANFRTTFTFVPVYRIKKK